MEWFNVLVFKKHTTYIMEINCKGLGDKGPGVTCDVHAEHGGGEDQRECRTLDLTLTERSSIGTTSS